MADNGRRPRISATDAAFAGFGLVRRAPGAFLVWTVLTLIYSATVTFLQSWLAGPYFAQVSAMQGANGTTPLTTEQATQLLGSLGSFTVFYLAVLVVALLYMAVMNAAIFRAVLSPGEGGLGFLRLGKDELRQAGVSFLYGLVIYGVYFVAILAGVFLAIAVAIGFAAAGAKEGAFANNPAAVAVAVLAGVAVVFLIIAPVLIVAVRLSLAGPLTFARGKVDLFGAWKLTKGRFWTLLGAYLLAALVVVVISTLVLVIMVVVAVVAGSSLETVSHAVIPDPKSIQDALLSPLHLIFLVVNAPLSALWIAVQTSIPATVYAQIAAARSDPGPDRSHMFGSPVAYPTVAPPPAAPQAPPPAPSSETPPDML